MDAYDRELLSRWSKERDADAFHEIVHRHAGMVYGSCLRILSNPQEAEDVSQDCFLTLARAPTTVRSSLGGWLHQLATHRALDNLRSSKRRKVRDGRFATVSGTRVEPDWDDTKGYVDEAIESLPRKYRVIVVSHFLESQTYETIAAVQGMPISTIASRARRGVELIRENLKKQGIVIPATILTTFLAENTATAAPTALISSLGKLAVAGSSGMTASAVAFVPLASLSKVVTVIAGVGAITALSWWMLGQKEEGAAEVSSPVAESAVSEDAVTEAAAMTLVDVTTVAMAAQDEEPSEAVADAATPILDPTEPEEAKPVTSEISGHVIDEFGEFVAGAEVVISFAETGRIQGRHNMAQPYNQFKTVSDAEGAFHVTGVPYQDGYGMVFASADGMLGEAMFDYGYVLERGLSIDVVLKSGDLLDGRILSADGAPVPNAYVEAIPSSGEGHAISDGAGRFELLSSDTTYHLKVFTTIGDGVFRDIPWLFEAVTDLRLDPQAALHGQIASADGAPAQGMRIVLSSRFMEQALGQQRQYLSGEEVFYVARTGEDGRYEVSGVFPNSPYSIHVESAEGKHLSPEIDIGELNSGQERQWDYTLSELMHIKGVVVSKGGGKALQSVGVTVVPEGYTRHRGEEQLSTKVDSQGGFDFRFALTPGTYVVTPYYEIYPLETAMEAFGQSVYLEYAKTAELRLEMDAPFTISLLVVDEEGNPFPDAYIASSWRGEDRGMGHVMDWKTDENGLFSWDGFAPFGMYTLTVGARGFVQVESADYAGGAGDIFPTETIVLYRAAGIEAVAVDEQGVLIADTFLNIVGYIDEEGVAAIEVKTDRNGRFSAAAELPADATSLRVETIPGHGTEEAMLFWDSGAIDLPPNQVLNLGEIVLISG